MRRVASSCLLSLALACSSDPAADTTGDAEAMSDEAGEAGAEKGKPARVAKQHGYDKAPIKHPPVADARKVLNWIDTRIKTMRAREAAPEKIAFEKGRLRGHEEAAGLKELPAAALIEEETSSDE